MQDKYLINSFRILLGILLAELLIMQVSGVSMHTINGNPLFSLPADPLVWLPFLAGIPQFLLQNYQLSAAFDLCLFAGIVLLLFKPTQQIWAIVVFVFSFLYFVSIMSRHIHWNFQEGFFIILFPLCFRSVRSKLFAFEAVRYFLLFFYGSAGLLKIISGSYLNSQHLAHLLSGQFGPYFIEGNTGWRTSLHLYLVNTPSISHLLFIGSIILELFALVGFFTKKLDPYIAIALLLFHLADWIMMDIAPFGQIAFICLLFFSRQIFSNPLKTPSA